MNSRLSKTERDLAMLIQANGKSPFEDWLQSIRDKTTRLKLLRQIDKLRRGLGIQKSLKIVSELKIDIGPGYRVYYALLDQKTLVVLIGGGDKTSQSQDIKNAQQLWKAFADGGHVEIALRAWNPGLTSAEEVPL